MSCSVCDGVFEYTVPPNWCWKEHLCIACFEWAWEILMEPNKHGVWHLKKDI